MLDLATATPPPIDAAGGGETGFTTGLCRTAKSLIFL